MKKLSVALTSIMMISVVYSSSSQDSPTLPAQKTAIEALGKLMVGKWEGTGWKKQGQAEPEPVNIKENIELKNGGTTLLVQGLGTHPETNKTVHDALAIIYYDPQSSTYRFDSHLSSGLHKLSTGTLENNVFIWGFDLPNNASIKYTITISGDEWNEIGEYSPNKDQWYKFFEMNLNKL